MKQDSRRPREYLWMITPPISVLSVYFALLATVAFTDISHRIIPDELTLGGVILCLPLQVIGGNGSAAIAGCGTGYILFALIRRTGRGFLGAGDVKLSALAGLCLGPFGWSLCMCAGSVAALLYAAAGALNRLRSPSAALPFAPFILLGSVAVSACGRLLQGVCA